MKWHLAFRCYHVKIHTMNAFVTTKTKKLTTHNTQQKKQEICQCHKNGGRAVISHASNSVTLMDVPLWTDAMTRCMQNRYPFMDISVRQSRSSLSGFCLTFRQHRPTKEVRFEQNDISYAFYALLIICTIAFMVLFYLSEMPSW